MIEYELRSLDSAAPDDGDQSLTGSRLRTIVRRDFYSLRASDRARASGLVEVADGVYYRFFLPPAQDSGSAAVSLVRVEDREQIAEFINQETTQNWLLTRNFSVRIAPEHTGLYVKVFEKSEDAMRLAQQALIREADDQRRFGDETANVTAALAQCMTPSPPQSPDSPELPETPEEHVGQALSVAITHILRSPPLTQQLRDFIVETPWRGNLEFREFHITQTIPAGAGVLEYVDNQLGQALALFSDIYEGLDFAAAFDRSTPAASSSQPQHASNARQAAIHGAFANTFGSRNVAIAKVKLRNGETIYYHAVSGTKTWPALTPQASSNPHRYIAVTAGGSAITAKLPWLANLTPLYSWQTREDDTERLLADAILRRHRADDVADVNIISRLPICHSCAITLLKLAEQMPNTQFVFAGFPAAVKTPRTAAGVTPLRPLRTSALALMSTTRMPAHG